MVPSSDQTKVIHTLLLILELERLFKGSSEVLPMTRTASRPPLRLFGQTDVEIGEVEQILEGSETVCRCLETEPPCTLLARKKQREEIQ